jgi:hypothetical protein
MTGLTTRTGFRAVMNFHTRFYLLILLRRLRTASLAASRLLLIRLFQPKPDILGVVEPSTTTAGGDLKEPDK